MRVLCRDIHTSAAFLLFSDFNKRTHACGVVAGLGTFPSYM